MRLSLEFLVFLSQLPYPSNGRPEGLDDRCHRTQTAATIDVSILLQSGFEVEPEGRSNRRTTQRSRSSRGGATTSVHTEINNRLFRAQGPQVPRTRESAEKMIKLIVDSISQFKSRRRTDNQDCLSGRADAVYFPLVSHVRLGLWSKLLAPQCSDSDPVIPLPIIEQSNKQSRSGVQVNQARSATRDLGLC
ncbi:hypothetical protein EDB83DRAFT_2350520 [Lactarius deliciosus]|nr:hypothetical protein EDB83DRAFT_2350520 [Lactarius deliciosus]